MAQSKGARVQRGRGQQHSLDIRLNGKQFTNLTLSYAYVQRLLVILLACEMRICSQSQIKAARSRPVQFFFRNVPIPQFRWHFNCIRTTQQQLQRRDRRWLLTEDRGQTTDNSQTSQQLKRTPIWMGWPFIAECPQYGATCLIWSAAEKGEIY